MKTLYYFSDYTDIMGSVNTDGSLMQTLFYGHGADGAGREIPDTQDVSIDVRRQAEGHGWCRSGRPHTQADDEAACEAGKRPYFFPQSRRGPAHWQHRHPRTSKAREIL